MALIHSLKNTLVNQPIAVVLLIVLIYASFFRTLIVTASPDLFKYPVLRQVYFFTTPGGFAPIFPDICYHLTHYKPAAADIP
ncbi:hypothetical protein ABMY82_24125, partial [Escherichia coli]